MAEYNLLGENNDQRDFKLWVGDTLLVYLGTLNKDQMITLALSKHLPEDGLPELWHDAVDDRATAIRIIAEKWRVDFYGYIWDRFESLSDFGRRDLVDPTIRQYETMDGRLFLRVNEDPILAPDVEFGDRGDAFVADAEEILTGKPKGYIFEYMHDFVSSVRPIAEYRNGMVRLLNLPGAAAARYLGLNARSWDKLLVQQQLAL